MKCLFLPSFLNYILTGYRTIGCCFFPFSTLKKLVHTLLASVVSDEKFVIFQTIIPLFEMYHFSLEIFKIFLSMFGYQQFDYIGSFLLFFLYFFVFTLLGVHRFLNL